MAKSLKKFNLNGQEVGSVAISDGIAEASVNSQLIKDYIVALRANARQWSANTKGRSEVNHSTKKPHAQKGGGRSRQGSLAAPQYKGGGRVFGPKPKFDQHVRINQKEKQGVIRAILGEKIREGRIIVLDNSEMKAPKTATVKKFINSATQKGKRVLLLAEGAFDEIEVAGEKKQVSVHSDRHDNIRLSLRNIPFAEFKLVQNVSGYDLLLANDIVITEPAMKQLTQWLLKDEQG